MCWTGRQTCCNTEKKKKGKKACKELPCFTVTLVCMLSLPYNPHQRRHEAQKGSGKGGKNVDVAASPLAAWTTLGVGSSPSCFCYSYCQVNPLPHRLLCWGSLLLQPRRQFAPVAHAHSQGKQWLILPPTAGFALACLAKASHGVTLSLFQLPPSSPSPASPSHTPTYSPWVPQVSVRKEGRATESGRCQC